MSELAPDELALLDEVADAVVRRRLAVPAMMFLETMAPMNVVGSSLLHVAAPIWRVVLPASRIETLARLLERRQAVPELVRRIDEREERWRRERAEPANPTRSPP